MLLLCSEGKLWDIFALNYVLMGRELKQREIDDGEVSLQYLTL